MLVGMCLCWKSVGSQMINISVLQSGSAVVSQFYGNGGGISILSSNDHGNGISWTYNHLYTGAGAQGDGHYWSIFIAVTKLSLPSGSNTIILEYAPPLVITVPSYYSGPSSQPLAPPTNLNLSVPNATFVVGHEFNYVGQAGADIFDAGALMGGQARGMGGADTLFGNSHGDSLYGGGGDDAIYGNGGSDRLYGGAGNDTIRLQAFYGNGSSEHALASGGTGNDRIYGSVGSDVRLFGDDGDDIIDGLVGNDTLTGGRGADQLIGGDGTDTASYKTAKAGVIASLTSPAGNSGDAAGDTYASIEALRGSAFGDTLIGDGAANSLYGEGGNDMLSGGSGADRLTGGEGDDTLSGGYDADRFIFTGAFGDDTIVDWDVGPGNDRIALKSIYAASFGELTAFMSQQGDDTLIDLGTDSILIENATISSFIASDFLFI